MLRKNSAAANPAEAGAQFVRHIVRIKLIGAIGQLQVHIRNFDIYAKRRARGAAADGTMTNTDICQSRCKRKTDLIAGTVSHEHACVPT